MDTGEFFMLKNIKNNIIAQLLIKSTLLSVISILVLTYLFSFLVLKLDVPKEYYQYISFTITGLSTFITAYFSTKKYSNNYILLSLISCIIIFGISFFNGIASKSALLIIINSAIIITICIISSLLNSKFNKRF